MIRLLTEPTKSTETTIVTYDTRNLFDKVFRKKPIPTVFPGRTTYSDITIVSDEPLEMYKKLLTQVVGSYILYGLLPIEQIVPEDDQEHMILKLKAEYVYRCSLDAWKVC